MTSRIAVLIPLLLLAACGEPAANYERADPEPPPVAAPALPPVPAAAWTNGEGGELVLRENGADVMRLTCRAAGELTAQVTGFKPVGSEERMTVGSGETVTTLVATVSETGNPPVQASGPAEPALLAAIEAGGKIAANYGYQNAGPFDAPSPEVARAFAASCR